MKENLKDLKIYTDLGWMLYRLRLGVGEAEMCPWDELLCEYKMLIGTSINNLFNQNDHNGGRNGD